MNSDSLYFFSCALQTLLVENKASLPHEGKHLPTISTILPDVSQESLAPFLDPVVYAPLVLIFDEITLLLPWLPESLLLITALAAHAPPAVSANS